MEGSHSGLVLKSEELKLFKAGSRRAEAGSRNFSAEKYL